MGYSRTPAIAPVPGRPGVAYLLRYGSTALSDAVPVPPPRYRAPISGFSSTSRPVPASRTRPFSSTTPWVDSRRPARAFCSTSRTVLPGRVHHADGVEHRAQHLGRQAHGRLVQDDQGRVEHEAPGELDQPLLAAGQAARLLRAPRRHLRGTSPGPAARRRPAAAVADRVAAELEVLRAPSCPGTGCGAGARAPCPCPGPGGGCAR